MVKLTKKNVIKKERKLYEKTEEQLRADIFSRPKMKIKKGTAPKSRKTIGDLSMGLTLEKMKMDRRRVFEDEINRKKREERYQERILERSIVSVFDNGRFVGTCCDVVFRDKLKEMGFELLTK